MFDILFGWRKASKCKNLIKQVQCRLKLLKNKRYTIVRQLREDVAELIKHGHEDKALNRVEEIIKDECVVALYESLDHYCEFILINLPYIRQHKDCPNDINEAVSSLIYASARCGELPELRLIRKLFGERYGQKFSVTALELLTGNLVNCQVIEKLSTKPVSDDMKHRLVSEISRNYCIKPEVLAIEYYSEWQQKEKEITGDQVLDADVQASYERNETSEMQIVNVEEMEREDGDVDSSVSSTCGSSSVAMQTVPLLEYNFAEVGFPNISPLGAEETESSTAGSTSHGTTRDGDILIYFDDIEEVKPSKTRDGDSQDQRIFKFKATMPKRDKLESSCDLSYVDCYETWSENSSGSKCSRSSSKGTGKRPRKRSEESIRWHDDSLKDNDCSSYYGRKHQKKTLVGETERSHSAQKSLKMGADLLSCKCLCSANRLSCCCSLQHPCGCCNGNDNSMDVDVLPWKQNRMITTRVGFPNHGHEHCQHQHFYCNGELNKAIEWGAVPREPTRTKSYANEAMVYNVFTYPDDSMRNKVLQGRADESKSVGRRRASISPSSPDVTNSWSTRKEAAPPYFRAVTMPPERAKNSHKDDFQRSFSDAFPYPTHVHPKLPDYDDIAAKFMALKKERLQNNPHCSSQKL